MVAPTWLGATSGQLPASGQINQFLVTHPSTIVYTGTLLASQTTTGSGSTNSNGTYIAQSFSTGTGTAVGRVMLGFSVTGTPSPLTVQLRTNSAGAPSSTVLQTTVIPPNWGNATEAIRSIPLPVSGLAASTTYWIVMLPSGDASDFFSFFASSSTTPAGATSTNGTSWSATSHAFLYAVYDQTVRLPLMHTWEDSGARITLFGSNTGDEPTSIEEYTVAQGSGQFVYSFRGFTYSGNSITAIA